MKVFLPVLSSQCIPSFSEAYFGFCTHHPHTQRPNYCTPKHNLIEFIFLFSIPSIFPLFMPLSLPSITTATKQSNLLISFKFQGSFSHGGSRYCVLLHMRYAISTNFLQSWNFSVTNSKSHLSTGYASHTNHKLTDELNARYIE